MDGGDQDGGDGPMRGGRAGGSRLVRAVAAAIFLQWAGNNAMLPLLPLDVRSRGGSAAVVGAVMAGYFAAAVVAQYPAGRLADRFGRLRVFVAGQCTYAAGALLFLVPVSSTLDVAFRALQGAGAGGAEVAALAIVARAVPVARRGRAFGAVYGAGLGGMALGPLLGSLAGTGALPVVFAAAAVAALVACAPVVAATRARRGERAGDVPAPPRPAPSPSVPPAASPAPLPGAVTSGGSPRAGGTLRQLLRPSLLGALLAAAVIGATSGLYEACWSLLLHHRGATDWEIGLSWTLYGVPYAAMSRPAGWLADHLDRRRLAVAALLWVLGFCAAYPFVPGVAVLLGLAVGESVGFVVALPAAQSLLGQEATPEQAGRVQGLFAASQTGATALAAATTGALFGVAVWLPFEVVAGVCVVVVVAAGLVWRPAAGRAMPQRGRVERDTSRTAPGGGVAPVTLAGGPDERGDGPPGSTR